MSVLYLYLINCNGYYENNTKSVILRVTATNLTKTLKNLQFDLYLNTPPPLYILVTLRAAAGVTLSCVYIGFRFMDLSRGSARL